MAGAGEEDAAEGAVSWRLVQCALLRKAAPAAQHPAHPPLLLTLATHAMLFVGREECDLTLKSRSVDKRHAVINFDYKEKKFQVKDLNSSNGTFVNEVRIPGQTYVWLESMDRLRFGYDSTIYQVQKLVKSFSEGEAQQDISNTATISAPVLCEAVKDVVKKAQALSNGSNTLSANLTPEAPLRHSSSEGILTGRNQVNGGGATGCQHAPHKHHTLFPSSHTEQNSMEPDSLQVEAYGGSGELAPTHEKAPPTPTSPQVQAMIPPPQPTATQSPGLQKQQSVPGFQCTMPGSPVSSMVGEAKGTVMDLVMDLEDSVPVLDPSAILALDPTMGSREEEVSELDRKLSVSNLQASSSMGSIHSAFSEDSLTGTEMTAPVTEMISSCPGDLPPGAGPGVQQPAHSRLQAVTRGSSLDGQQRERWTSGGHRRGAMNSSALYGPPDWWEAHKLSPANGDIVRGCLSKSKSADRVPVMQDREGFPQLHRDERGLCHSESAVVMDPSGEQLEANSERDEGRWGASSSSSASKTPPSPPLQPMAFTVDLTTAGHDSADPAEGKRRLDISDSISKFAPRHRRNHSIPKADEEKAKGDKGEKSEPKDTVKPFTQSPAVVRKSFASRKAGYHSEGYFSSDQEEDVSVKSDFSVNKTRNGEKVLRGTVSNPLEKTMSDSKGKTALMGEMHAFGRSLEESASHFINKVLGSSPEKRREPIRSASMGNDPLCIEENDANADLGGGVDDGEGAHSEAGTYTIDKESPCPEEEKARKNIDQVFGVHSGEVTLENGRPLPPGLEEKLKLSSQRGSPNWIREWAAQVAEQHQQRAQTKPQEKNLMSQPKTKASTPTGMRMAETLSSSPAASGPTRPRRRLPSLPTDQTPHSDSNLETESFLRDTESVVTAMQARMTRSFTGSLMSAPSPSFDSGGPQEAEDVEPSADSDPGSCSGNEFSGRVRTSRNGILGRSNFRKEVKISETDPGAKSLSAQLRAKLRLLENSARPASPTSGEKAEVGKQRAGTERRLGQTAEEDDVERGQDDNSVMQTSGTGHQTRYNRAFRCMPANDFDMRCMEDLNQVRSPAVDSQSDCMRRQAITCLRRGRLGMEELPSSVAASRKKPSALPTPSLTNSRTPARGRGATMSAALSRSSSTSSAFNRADGGRFSLRVPKGTTQSSGLPPKSRPTSAKTRSEAPGVGGPPNTGGAKRGRGSGNPPGRSNSTLSSREVEFQNWKRRKSYDPMKAAAEGKKKREEARKAATGVSNVQAPQSPTSPSSGQALNRTVIISEASSRNSRYEMSPPNPLLRSASFHGTPGSEGVTSEEDEEEEEEDEEEEMEDEDPTLSMEEGEDSPAVMSPTSAAASALLVSRSMAYHRTKAALSQRAATAPSPDLVLSSSRKSSLDETLDLGLSFLRSTTPNSSIRGRAKLEALDNLVIAAIYGFSNKIKGSSYNLLKKLRRVYEGDVEKCEVLSEVINLLEEGDNSSVSSPSKSPSKELSGTLKNLKKLENVFAALEEVLLGDEDVESSDAEGEKAISF
ncbi:uncharacterized protein LOC124167108 isoform X3 [Ischnura elegans]|uniref:uncharacterized protein LOC124167108 isoform X3 n=1 Tax=Ischnura elegans TaxID=197161 RepID=UPI001ED88C16|nr:uncharacterized protein LOC124167108 isoform X3 [Ischnura elegans]